MRELLVFAILVVALLAMSGGFAELAGPVSANPPAGAELVDKLTAGPWKAGISRLADGTLNGVALREGQHRGYLACRDGDWSVGFIGSWGPKWDRLVAWIEKGRFGDAAVRDLGFRAPFVIYRPVQFIVGRADWALDGLHVERPDHRDLDRHRKGHVSGRARAAAISRVRCGPARRRNALCPPRRRAGTLDAG